MEKESKEERFKRIAARRTKRILEDLRRLGNCANKGTYAYTLADVNKIFSAIDDATQNAKARFTKEKTEFTL